MRSLAVFICIALMWPLAGVADEVEGETFKIMRYTRQAASDDAQPPMRAYVKIITRPTDGVVDLVVVSNGKTICSDVMQAGTSKVRRSHAIDFYWKHGRN